MKTVQVTAMNWNSLGFGKVMEKLEEEGFNLTKSILLKIDLFSDVVTFSQPEDWSLEIIERIGG